MVRAVKPPSREQHPRLLGRAEAGNRAKDAYEIRLTRPSNGGTLRAVGVVPRMFHKFTDRNPLKGHLLSNYPPVAQHRRASFGTSGMTCNTILSDGFAPCRESMTQILKKRGYGHINGIHDFVTR